MTAPTNPAGRSGRPHLPGPWGRPVWGSLGVASSKLSRTGHYFAQGHLPPQGGKGSAVDDRARRRSISPQEADQLALDAHSVGTEYARLIGGIGRFERDRGAAAPKALERRLLVVDQRDDNVAGLRGVLLANDHGVVVVDARFDHRIPADLEREMLAPAEEIGGHGEGLRAGLDRLDRRAGGAAAHERHHHRMI